MNLKPKMTAVAVMTAFAMVPAFAGAEETLVTDAVTVTGILPERLEAVPGSFDVVGKKELEERRPISIKEALNEVPGINIVGEDSMGLALNIGVRGMNPRRTARTLLMEDGMPIFLAPYGDPSAHYSTPLDRVDRIEVVKGSGQILYGPQTVGGMINFVTKPVPRNGFAGSVTATIGTDDFRSGHLNIGTGNERGGFMIDAIKRKGDGIRDHHKFDIEEYTVKGELDLTDRQTIKAKVSTFREDSNISETGLGLTEYNQDKFQAPTGMNDEFRQTRDTVQLQHIFDITENVRLSTQAYYVDIFRASFRQTRDTDGDGGVSRLGQCPALGDVDDWTEDDGDQFDTAGNEVRGPDGQYYTRVAISEVDPSTCGGAWRPRNYTYYGIEPRLDIKHNAFGLESDLVLGMRLHWEDIGRDQYSFSDPRAFSLSWTKDNGLHREKINHQVDAQSYYAQNTFYAGNWAITPGVRVEHYKIKKQILIADETLLNSEGGEYENGDGRPGLRYSQSHTEVLPGFGVAWNGIANTTVFGGVHRGFAPARPDRDLAFIEVDDDEVVAKNTTKPELSTNYEIGVRSNYFKGVSFASTLFHTEFDDIVVAIQDGAYRNAGKSEMSGLELAGRIDFGTIYNTPHNFYVTGTYTNLFNAKFKSSGVFFTADEEDRVGEINSGDRLPYAPRNIASLNFGYSHPIGVNVRFGADYVSEQKPTPDADEADILSGKAGTIPSYTLFNASATFKPVGSKVTYFMSGHNLGDKEYLATRVDGMHVGRGRTVFGGITYDF